MTNNTWAWAVYDRLVQAKAILGNVPRQGNQETLNDAIDAAFGILHGNLDKLAEILENLEEQR